MSELCFIFVCIKFKTLVAPIAHHSTDSLSATYQNQKKNQQIYVQFEWCSFTKITPIKTIDKITPDQTRPDHIVWTNVSKYCTNLQKAKPFPRINDIFDFNLSKFERNLWQQGIYGTQTFTRWWFTSSHSTLNNAFP